MFTVNVKQKYNNNNDLCCVSVVSHWNSVDTTQKEITSQTDEYIVILSSKTYVFEDKSTK